ncbi:MAG: sugar kinase [Anaerolineae bacterium]|jgi:sugar/nucleoside kinase (ribokinase family)|nr:sugar kinase [Chloroflexota bacterium]
MGSIAAIGEALVEIMRTELDQPLDRPAGLVGPFASGAPAIFADAVAKLGADALFVGTVGKDAFGDCIVNRLTADGVNCSAMRRHPQALTGIAFVSYRSDGSRNFVFHLADAAAAHVSLSQIPRQALDAIDHVHIMGSSLSGSEAMREACYALAAEVHGRGGTVSLDPNLRPELLPVERIREVCEPIVSRARVVLPSGAELTALTGQTEPDAGATYLLERGVELVALKLGDQGSRLYTRDGALDVAPYHISEVDPTGAGDCYDAAIIVGLAEGWDLARVGRFANAAGALATTRQGPLEGVPTRAELQRFMESQRRPL